ncbi:hypothetical protein GPALN_010819 [Globodera pallida]|nr:hypothetical protein GPALN_010819 [Globodera pallida]
MPDIRERFKNNSNNKIMLGAEGHGCQSLLKGESLSDGTELVEKVTLAFQTGGQKLIENLKRKEMEAKIAVNGGGTLAEILPLTKVDNILRMLEAKMSAGPAKDAVQNLLAQNSAVMPSDMVQLVMNLWLIVFNREEGNADHMLQRQQIQQSLLQSFKCCSSSVPAALIRKEKPALRRRYKRMISSRRHFLHEFGLFLASLTIICLIAFVLSIGLEKMDKILNQIMLTAAIAAYLYLRLINTPKLVRDFLQI